MSSIEPGARERLPPASPFLFSEIPLEGTLEELRRVYRRRVETAGPGQRLDEAYTVARTCLEAALDEARAPGSSLVAPRSSPGSSAGSSPGSSAGSSPGSSAGSSEVPVAAESETGSEGARSRGAPAARNAEDPPESFPSEAASGSA